MISTAIIGAAGFAVVWMHGFLFNVVGEDEIIDQYFLAIRSNVQRKRDVAIVVAMQLSSTVSIYVYIYDVLPEEEFPLWR